MAEQIKIFTVIVHLLIVEEVGYRGLQPDGALNPQKVTMTLVISEGSSGFWGLWGTVEYVSVNGLLLGYS